jgi:DNA-binding SARP family transcriptional activator
MQFTVLGSFEVRSPGTRISITAPKQRAVLATLLLDANTEVSVERLSRYVWDGQPPVAAQTTLQSYIYRLRQLLSSMSGVKLETSPSSYLLHADAENIDLWAFRNRAAVARQKKANGATIEFIKCLRDALSLWRGNALVGVPGEAIQQEGRHLEGERIAAYEELFSTELSLGNHRQIIPELQKLVSVNQFHESLRAQLMLAFYRSGRQAEALQHYALIRRKLREDLGIDPGAELQEVHKAILEQVPSAQIVLS